MAAAESSDVSVSREFDVLVYGIGYTGQQVCQQLIDRSKADKLQLRLAIAARNQEKLAKLEQELSARTDETVSVSTFAIPLGDSEPEVSPPRGEHILGLAG